jgi:hypothetical protein
VLLPQNAAAVTFLPDLENPHRMIVLPTDDRRDIYGDVVTHELVHLISYTAIHTQPAWFAEGIATFFETTRVDNATGRVDVGVPSTRMARSIQHRRPLTSTELFACRELECRDFQFYASAWALFSYLINAHGQELAAYEAAIDRGDAFDSAWDKSFASLPRDAIDREVHTWLVAGQHVVWHFSAKLAAQSLVERTLGDADVYAARALLRFEFNRQDTEWKDDLAAALAKDPQHKLALAIQRAAVRGHSLPQP